MTTALQSSFRVLCWSALFIVAVTLLIALVMCQSLFGYYLQDDSVPIENRREVFTYFGTFLRAMLSMFEITLGNWPPIARVLFENLGPWLLIFSVVHKLTIGFAVVGVING